MSRHQLEGIEVWFGTPDAPAPSGVETEAAPEITVGTSSDVQAVVVTVHYRRTGGPWQRLVLRPGTTTTEARYFNGRFPKLPTGVRIEYKVYVRCGGTRPKPERQVGGTNSFEIAQSQGNESTSSRARSSAVARSLPSNPRDANTTNSPSEPPKAGSTMKIARLARLPMNAAHRLATAAPERALLGDETVGSLVSEGAVEERDVNRLGLASVALDLAEDDEAAAGEVMAAFETHGVEKPQDLARLTAGEISSVIERSGAIVPEIAKKKGAALKARVANAFPTETLMNPSGVAVPPPGTLSGSPRSEAIKRVLERNAGVDWMRLDLSHHSPAREMLDLSGLSEPEKKVFLRDVQLRQGTLTVAGKAEIAEKLLTARLGSPVKLAASTPGRLAKAADLTPKRAKNVHNRALHTLGRFSNGLFTLWDALHGGLADLAVGNVRRAKVSEFFDGLDNLQELFGEQDTCQCEHCNSILGPAAYFVDLMHFVETHVLNDEVAEGEAPFKGKQGHRLHLRTRRPDLWVLPLTCENTHTEIPQLRITSEIFENFIAKKRGIAISPDRAEVIASVYGEFLPSGRHSILQPFQLPLEELEIYLGHFKLRRSDITRLLDEPEEVQFRTELGVSAIHANLIASPAPSAVNIHDTLGLTLPADGVLPMRELLKATQLPRPELGEILQTRFVGGEQPPVISAEKKSPESVQYDIERVRGLTLDHLDRVHRFLRLKKHLTWSSTELDAFLASAGGGVLDSTSLIEVGRAVYLQRRFRASVQELCALAGDLPDFPLKLGQENTPIELLFNVPDLVREDPSYPESTIRFVLGSSGAEASERSMRLRAGLRLDEGELTALIEGLSEVFAQGYGGNRPTVLSRLFSHRLRYARAFALPRFVPAWKPRPLPIISAGDQVSFPLARHNLSLLYRHAVLGRWLKLCPTDLLTLIRLTPGVGDHITNLADCIAVVEFYDWWKSTAFSLEDLSMLLAPPESITQQVEELWEAIQAWLEEQSGIALSDTFLTQIGGVSEELSREIIAANENVFEEDETGGYHVLASWRDDTTLDLSALEGTDISPDSVLDLIRSYHPDDRLPRALTQALCIEIALARTIVQAALMGENELTPSAFLQPGSLPSELRGAMDALLRLHRLGTGLRLAPRTLEFFARNQTTFGVSSWSDQNPHALRRMATFQAIIKDRFRDQPEIALGEVQRLFGDLDLLPQVAASLFDMEPVLARDLANTLQLPDNPICALAKLEAYAEMTGKLSVDAATLANIASEDYDKASTAAAAVLAGFRAKYPDEDAWQEKFEPFEERVLEKKRDALIDYLLHGPDAVFPDATEMYKYFLIDGEVDGCFRTSRVVAATSSLQLYVHRIRMNLEKEPQGGLRVEPSLIPDEEWEWRKHYRVWEANRKIFLWPENYLDPTTRDDKTPLFEELESELLQQEITDQTVADAYANYLKGLEELVNLRYAGAYHHYLEDDDSGEVTDVIYLFGATGGDAPTHYWREIRNLAHSRSEQDLLASPQYGPWHKVDARIPTRHVSPVVYDRRLHVFWNEITTTPRNAVNDGQSRFVGYSHRYALKFTSLRLDGQWTPPERISLLGSGKAFMESDDTIDDPLAELPESLAFIKNLFDPENFRPGFGIFANPNLADELQEESGMLTPRYGTRVHTKAREGYTLSGFMWERPHLSLEPSYGHRLLINCAGFLVRGAVDLFDRQVLLTDDTHYKKSEKVGRRLLAYRAHPLNNLTFIRKSFIFTQKGPIWERSSAELAQANWSSVPFDYPVVAALALNPGRNMKVFKRHWGENPGWKSHQRKIADIPLDANVWAVAGTPNKVVIEGEVVVEREVKVGDEVVTEHEAVKDLLLLQPDAHSNGSYLLHRLGTTLVRNMARKLFTEGLDGLLSTGHQLELSEPAPQVTVLAGTDMTEETSNPIANESAYGIYYQEIFKHIPLLLAHHLNARGKFEEAQRWYHYVFDPTSPEPPTDSDAPETDRNWKYRQFRGQEQAKLSSILSDATAIQKYREDPFNTHAIARLRPTAYQKAVVMRYIDNLLDWADDQFTRFQMESVNEAMMLYMTAAEILGPRPALLGECGELSDSTRTYNKLKDSLAEDGEFLLEVEQLIPRPSMAPPSNGGAGAASLGQPTSGLSALLVATGMLPAYIPVVSVAPELLSVGTTAATGMLPAYMPVASVAPVLFSVGPTAATATEDDVTEVVGDPESLMGTDPFAKVATVMPRTEALVQSFASRQKFAFLGGRWKTRGGRSISPTLGDRFSRAVVRQVTVAFCIPRNELLDDYWNRVEDRIWKIRTCRDIAGRRRKLSLFAPPIDPGLLARARALGISLDDAIGAFEGMIPLYRFPYLLEKAKAFAGTVQSFGAALQAALERKDGEELALLQATQQQQILALTTKAKDWELESAQANLEATERRRTAVQNRQTHYAGLLDAGLNEWEVTQTIATHTASVIKGGAVLNAAIAGVLGLIPQAGSPFAMTYGGVQLKGLPASIAFALQLTADVANLVATSASLEAGWDRRSEDWTFQRDQASDELSQIEKQIEAARIGRDLAEHAIKLHEKSIEHNEELREYYEDKFSSLGFYTWLASELQRTYREAYNMAYRMARYAEQAYRFEREDYTSELLSGDYWDASRAGLLAGNRLTLELQHLEQRYVETDCPKRELLDHVFSLRQWDPKALIELRQKGECKFKVPELFFDISSPGDYRRRIRSVRVTIPAVAGPYVNVMATLSLDASWIRTSPSVDPQEAPRPRIDSITTSSARNDAGAFELNFRGEKYVPFEGAGAVSEWSLSLPTSVRMFDYNTITDVVLHFDYTASFDGAHRDVVQGVTEGFVSSLRQRLSDEGIVRAFSLREEFPPAFSRLVAADTVELDIDERHLPFFARDASVSEAILILTGPDDNPPSISSVEFDGETLDSTGSDERVQGISVPLQMRGSPPWKHEVRFVELSGQLSNAYLVMKLGLAQT